MKNSNKPTAAVRQPSRQQQKFRKLKRKQQEMKERQIHPAMIAWQFRKGVSGLTLKKGVKKAVEEFLKQSMDFVVPDIWLVNGLEPLKGRKLTFGQVLTFRMLYSATTGNRNQGLKDLQEILNRVLGKVPLVLKHGEVDDDDFVELTDDELNAELLRLSESVRTKRLPVASAEAVTDASVKTKTKTSEGDKGQ